MSNKDLILKVMIAGVEKTPNTYFTPDSLKDFLFPDLHTDEVEFLLKQIIQEKPELIKTTKIGGVPFATIPTGLVKSFLDNGGFTKVEKDKEEERLKKAKREAKTDQLLELDIDLKKFEKRIGKKILIGGAIFTVLNFFITLITIKSRENDINEPNHPEKTETLKTPITRKDSLNK